MTDGARPEAAKGKNVSALEGSDDTLGSATVGSAPAQAGSSSAPAAAAARGSGAGASGSGARKRVPRKALGGPESEAEVEEVDDRAQQVAEQVRAAGKGKGKEVDKAISIVDESDDEPAGEGRQNDADGDGGGRPGGHPPPPEVVAGAAAIEFWATMARLPPAERRQFLGAMGQAVHPYFRQLAAEPHLNSLFDQDLAAEKEGGAEKEKDPPALITLDYETEELFTFANRNTSSDPRIVEMLRAGFYWPLTGLTCKALRALNDGSKVKMIKTHSKHSTTAAGVHHILDAGVFPQEQTISIEDWREAWQNLLRLLLRLSDDEVQAMFHSHYEHLTRLPYFREEFEAILEFDIWVRHTWFTADPRRKPAFRAGGAKYLEKLSDIRLSAIRARLSAPPVLPPPAFQARFHPYSRDDRADEPPRRVPFNATRGAGARDQGQPFRGGRGPASAGPLCLICAGSGHMARTCGRTTLPNGRPVFAAWADNRLVDARSRRPICASWNVGGVLPCKARRCPGADECHVCAFCGSAGHTGADLRCVRA